MDLCNKHPVLYLGKDRDKSAYYFFGYKEKTGRFLKYVAYPMWCASSDIGNFIDLSAELPEEIMADVLLFVNGRVRYEIQPKRRGRAEKIIRHEIPREEAPKAEGISTPTLEGTPNRRRAVRSARTSPTTSPATEPVSITKTAEEQPKRPRGRPRKQADPVVANPGGNGVSRPDVHSAPAESLKPRRRRSAADPDVLVRPRASSKRSRSSSELPLVTPKPGVKRRRST